MDRAPALIALLAAACGEEPPGTVADAAVPDAMIDADLVSFPFRGRYLDWDSTAAAPCPIAGATWTARYDMNRVATTDASGAFSISLAPYTPLLDLTQPAGASACANPPGGYAIKGIAIAPPAVAHAGGELTARSMTAGRVDSFYASFGAFFDTTRGHLLVHVSGAPRAVSITGNHAAAQAFDGATWAQGASGAAVFFGNVEIPSTTMSTTVTVAGGALGTGSVPLEPGAITYMAVVPR